MLELIAGHYDVQPGAEISVSVSVRGFNAIISLQGSIAFDPSVIAFVEAEQFDLTGFDTLNLNTSDAPSGLILNNLPRLPFFYNLYKLSVIILRTIAAPLAGVFKRLNRGKSP